MFSTPEVAHLQYVRAGVNQHVLGLDVSVAYANRMYVSKGPYQLVSVELDQEGRHHLLHLEKVFHHSVQGVRDVVHDNVQIHLIWFVAIGVKRLSHFYAIGVVQGFQNLEFPIFITLVLEDLLDRYLLSRLRDGGSEDNSE